MWGLEGQVGIECAARWEKHFRQHKEYEQSDTRKKGNCGVFRGIGVGYYLTTVNIKWRDDKAGKTDLRMSHIMKDSECLGKRIYWRFYRKVVPSQESALRVTWLSM